MARPSHFLPSNTPQPRPSHSTTAPPPHITLGYHNHRRCSTGLMSPCLLLLLACPALLDLKPFALSLTDRHEWYLAAFSPPSVTMLSLKGQHSQRQEHKERVSLSSIWLVLTSKTLYLCPMTLTQARHITANIIPLNSAEGQAGADF